MRQMISVPLDTIQTWVDSYNTGTTLKQLVCSSGYSKKLIRNRLVQAGVVIRGAGGTLIYTQPKNISTPAQQSKPTTAAPILPSIIKAPTKAQLMAGR